MGQAASTLCCGACTDVDDGAFDMERCYDIDYLPEPYPYYEDGDSVGSEGDFDDDEEEIDYDGPDTWAVATAAAVAAGAFGPGTPAISTDGGTITKATKGSEGGNKAQGGDGDEGKVGLTVHAFPTEEGMEKGKDWANHTASTFASEDLNSSGATTNTCTCTPRRGSTCSSTDCPDTNNNSSNNKNDDNDDDDDDDSNNNNNNNNNNNSSSMVLEGTQTLHTPLPASSSPCSSSGFSPLRSSLRPFGLRRGSRSESGSRGGVGSNSGRRDSNSSFALALTYGENGADAEDDAMFEEWLEGGTKGGGRGAGGLSGSSTSKGGLGTTTGVLRRASSLLRSRRAAKGGGGAGGGGSGSGSRRGSGKGLSLSGRKRSQQQQQQQQEQQQEKEQGIEAGSSKSHMGRTFAGTMKSRRVNGGSSGIFHASPLGPASDGSATTSPLGSQSPSLSPVRAAMHQAGASGEWEQLQLRLGHAHEEVFEGVGTARCEEQEALGKEAPVMDVFGKYTAVLGELALTDATQLYQYRTSREEQEQDPTQ